VKQIPSSSNLQTLETALAYLAEVIHWRISTYFGETTQPQTAKPSPPADWLTVDTTFSRFIHQHQLDIVEQLTLLIALAPHLQHLNSPRRATILKSAAGEANPIGAFCPQGKQCSLCWEEMDLAIVSTSNTSSARSTLLPASIYSTSIHHRRGSLS